MTRGVSTIRCSQSIPSIQTPEFMAMLNQQVHDRTTHLNEKYKRLTEDHEELHRVVMEMRSHMGDPFAPSYWPYGLDDD
jgi:hypothetical protein